MQPYVREIGVQRHRAFEGFESLFGPADVVPDETARRCPSAKFGLNAIAFSAALRASS